MTLVGRRCEQRVEDLVLDLCAGLVLDPSSIRSQNIKEWESLSVTTLRGVTKQTGMGCSEVPVRWKSHQFSCLTQEMIHMYLRVKVLIPLKVIFTPLSSGHHSLTF